MSDNEGTILEHIGNYFSGRYPRGSGKAYEQRNRSFLGAIRKLHDQGLSDLEIAKGMEMSLNDLRRHKSIALNMEKAANVSLAQRLSDKGWSNVAIGERLGNRNESYVRSLLEPGVKERLQITQNIANSIKNRTDQVKYLDIGEGEEQHMGVPRTRFNVAVKMLEDQGYEIQWHNLPQPGTGKFTTVKMLVPPGTPYYNPKLHTFKTIRDYSENKGRNVLGLETPRSISSDRVYIRYDDDGGKERDGLIELRPGVPELSLGDKHYAQVRIEVDGTHYMKGMAVYSDDIPEGSDIIFNTKKSKAERAKVFKPLKEDPNNAGTTDPDNPFGAIIRQRHYIDANGEKQLSALNLVGSEKVPYEEGAWSTFKRDLSSQVLSKQKPSLAKTQLKMAYDLKEEEFDDIMQVTNPVIKKRLLDSFSDDCDSDSVHLEGAALPRQSWHVLIPVDSLKDNEVYAPRYNDGEQVVLIRHPHGGRFEIPELKVNNKNVEAKKRIPDALDAVGINSNVARKLSGADFDGDDVIVIPNNDKYILSHRSLNALKDFDPRSAYPGYEGMPKMKEKTKQLEMGKVSNLITDMTIKGANEDEIARAIKHSMVVIDALNHDLNYKLSAEENNIAELKAKYQGGPTSGAATLLSRAGADYRVPHRKDRGTVNTPVKINPKTGEEYGNTDPLTGKKVYYKTGETYEAPTGPFTRDEKTGKRIYPFVKDPITGKKVYAQTKIVPRVTKSKRMMEEEDAFNLVSGPGGVEEIYAKHANALKALGDRARKASLEIEYTPYSHSAMEVYSKEVASLESKLNMAYRNKPMERQALQVANQTIRAKKEAKPDMPPEELKKIRGMALREARFRVNPKGKQKVEITDREWEAIQAGAITKSRLSQILLNTDMDVLKQRAMPRTPRGMLPARIARARSMLSNGYNKADIARALGVNLDTLTKALE